MSEYCQFEIKGYCNAKFGCCFQGKDHTCKDPHAIKYQENSDYHVC